MTAQIHPPAKAAVLAAGLIVLLLQLMLASLPLHAQTKLPTPLSDVPLYSASNVPANLMLALSVEYPTGVVAAYTDGTVPLVYIDESGVRHTETCGGLVNNWGACYFAQMRYLGYFDYDKCYDYDRAKGYFVPVSTSLSHVCEGHWSGNMLNWATMSKLDEFRQVLMGGYRAVDTVDLTVLERARDSGQGAPDSPHAKAIGRDFNVAAATVVGDPTLLGTGNVYLRSSTGASDRQLTNCTDPDAAPDCRVRERGIFLQVADNPCFANSEVAASPNCRGTPVMKQFYVRVQVCVPGMLESNCNSAHAASDYPGAGRYNKPEGLIQTNYEHIRVGVAAYQHSQGNDRVNGALRALLRDNGPTIYNGLGPRSPNPNAEWSGSTGIFMANPAPGDISASSSNVVGAISASGAINYLSQFGRVVENYEVFDNVSELYYVALAYYKQHALEKAYVNSGAVDWMEADGFPIMLNQFNDPIQFTCQGNAIVVLGDSHTWYDTAVPSSSNVGAGVHAPLPPLVASGSDPGLDTKAWLDAVGGLPLVETNPTGTMSFAIGGNLSDRNLVGDPLGGNSYNIAGMAYYAHTQNMRPDLTDGKSGKEGVKVTVDTYVVDVMEPGAFDGSTARPTFDPEKMHDGSGPNHYWLAAKYGGFNVDEAQCQTTNAPVPCVTVTQAAPAATVKTPVPEDMPSWHTNASSVAEKDLRPDNYFPGNRPDLIQSGLSTIFNRVTSKQNLSAASPGIVSSRVLASSPIFGGTGIPIYQTVYAPGVWSGDVVGMLASADANGTLTPSVTWKASSAVDAVTGGPLSAGSTPVKEPWNTARRVVTFDSTRGVGIPFRLENLPASAQKAFPRDTNGSSPLLNFVRGDRSNEGSKYRIRTHVLGDIVSSGAVLVQGALSPSYSYGPNPGYAEFATRVASRAPMVFVGANDGMLHAFAGRFGDEPSANNPFTDSAGSPLGGTEQYAYVPSFVLQGPNNTPTVDGVAALANLNDATAHGFTHHFYVDATPQVADADFAWSCATPGRSCAPDPSPQWHTMLVGGLGKGGRGIYALDITTPPKPLDAWSSQDQESLIAKNVLWEFADRDLGFTYARPVVAKTRKYGWVVLVTSGYDNAASGRGYLFVVSARTGALLEKIATGAGSPAAPSGLGSPTPYTQDTSDGTIEQVYAGDLAGNVWRFDLSGVNDYPAPTLFATLRDSQGKPQPVTTAPRIEVDIDSTGFDTRRWVFVGTGRLLDLSDLGDATQQSFYALRDGTGSQLTSASLPLTRANLLENLDLRTGVQVIDASDGWFYDLTNRAPGGATERIVVDPDGVAGFPIVSWISMMPTSDPCQYAGQQYAVNFGTGTSALVNASGTIQPYLTFGQGLTGSEIVQIPSSPGSPPQYALIGQPLIGSPLILKVNAPPPSKAIGRTNWREVLDQ